MHRYALIVANEDSTKEKVEQYLYGNYRLISTGPRGHLIVGQDDSGFTLDAIIDRLATGLHWAREVKGTQLVVAHSEVAMHCRVAGLECHIIEEDRYVNGNEIPEDERSGCFVVATSMRNGGQLVPMLKDEAGWREHR